MKDVLMVTALLAALAFGTLARGAQPGPQVLSAPEEATQPTLLLGRNFADGMIVTFELKPARSMWLQMDNPPKWRERTVRKGEIYHLDVRPVDPKSKVVISYSDVRFNAVNRTNGKKVSGTLHPMWDGSGLHYAANSPLAGDGAYELIVSVGMPTFGRAPQYKDLWVNPVTTKFHFKLANGRAMEVSGLRGAGSEVGGIAHTAATMIIGWTR